MITPNFSEKSEDYWKEHEARKKIEEIKKKGWFPNMMEDNK